DQRFALQAASPRPGTLADIRTLAHHPDLGLHTPNRARAPVGTVANTNPAHVHTKSGEGYRLLANTLIAIDSFNAQTAAPTCSRFTAEKARLTLE
ncbi:MAG: aminopeptidase N C-terminal domain-containing protein, partial [Rhodospirillales bacterium]|nr:aminopeptidase N C-terminal domain-containing protein [Rhodospirillales bacterium]